MSILDMPKHTDMHVHICWTLIIRCYDIKVKKKKENYKDSNTLSFVSLEIICFLWEMDQFLDHLLYLYQKI